MKQLPSIYQFDDYRAYLKAALEEIKKTQHGFSYRKFSTECGFNSPSYVSMVLSKKRKLGVDGARKIANALKLSATSTDFLVALVGLELAKNLEQRAKHQGVIDSLRSKRQIKRIEDKHYKIIAEWYHLPIREMVTLKDFKEDPEWIANKLSPPITPHQAESSIQTLLKLGFLKRNKSGKLVQSEAMIDTPHQLIHHAGSFYHEAMTSHALRSIKDIRQENRELAAVTVGGDEKQMKALREDIRKFRDYLLKTYGESSKNNSDVYQVNLQAFSLIKKD